MTDRHFRRYHDSEIISVTEAHQRWGDLARIRNGQTTWIEVTDADGNVWKPYFDLFGLHLIGYERVS